MIRDRQLPPPEKTSLCVGFMRLSDSAPLLIAKESGQFARFGLEVELRREVSWANLRDKLVVGALDAAHLLAPLPMMTAHGAGGVRANLLTGLALGLNGNAITLSRALWERLDAGAQRTASGMAQALGEWTRAGAGPVTLATVHLFSMHTFLLRMWLRYAGIDPERELRIIVLPPEQMCDSLARGVIDGFCVGEPWNTFAVQQGIGAIAATGYEIWNNAPEKVLGVTESWHNRHPATHLRLRLAVMEACRTLDDPVQRVWAAEVLAGRSYLDLPAKVLLPSLTGRLRRAKQLALQDAPGFHVFGAACAGFPWRSQAEWMVRSSAALLGKAIDDEQCRALVQRCWRPDLYREAARWLGVPSPSRDARPEAQHAGVWEFEPGVQLGADLMIGGARFVQAVD